MPAGGHKRVYTGEFSVESCGVGCEDGVFLVEFIVSKVGSEGGGGWVGGERGGWVEEGADVVNCSADEDWESIAGVDFSDLVE